MQLMITPPANRGLNSQNVQTDTKSSCNRFTVGNDWIQGTLPIMSDEDVLTFVDFLERSVKDEMVLSPGTRCKHGKVWENEGTGAEGALIAWTLPERPGEVGSLWLSLSARIVERIGDVKQQCRFIRILLEEYSVNFTRLDVAIDDYEKELKFQTIVDTLKAKNYSGFQNWNVIENRDGGWTINLGSRQSESITRIYNKTVESKGEIDAIRWEREFKGAKAQELAKQIASLDFSMPDGWFGSQLARFALGGINFLIKSDVNLNRCKTVDWFESFLSSFLSPIKLRVQRIKPTIDRTVEWLKRSVSASLKLICSIKNDNFIDDLLKLGESKLGTRHYALMKTSKMQFSIT